jgi:hypothetical protein
LSLLGLAKALELFMISLVTKAAQQAKAKSSKRVTAVHLKEAIVKDEVLDFLADIMSKVPDQPAGASTTKKGATTTTDAGNEVLVAEAVAVERKAPPTTSFEQLSLLIPCIALFSSLLFTFFD